MKNRKCLSMLLCLALLASLLVLSTGATLAEDADADKTGMKISKTATANDDGSYTITLEAYATGSKVISEITKDIPTDIILVLDQSGSMDDDIGMVSFEQYKDEPVYWGTIYHTRNQDYYEYRHNGGSGNLWHKLEDGSYVSVSVKRDQYIPITNGKNDSTRNSATSYWQYKDNLYAKVNGEYQKVSVTRTRYSGTYTYTVGSTTIATSQGSTGIPSFTGVDGNILYRATSDDSKYVYIYTYTDASGTEQTIGTSTGADTVFKPTLYERTTVQSGTKRIDALKSAATSFVNAVADKAKGADSSLGTDDDINHRIAVVGFASQSDNGNNTELLSISGSNSGSVGVAYNDISDQNLKDVVQDMNTTDGQAMVSNAINALAAKGATRVDLGLDMAKRILNANPVSKNEERNRVVIVFTDGSPTSSNGFERTVANNAISTANSIKNEGTTVYTIGIFSGADASSAGNEPSEDYSDDWYYPNYTEAQMSAACNWFMQKVSSNDGTPQRPSYYLSAADSGSLNNIFQQISDQIESGGSSSTLTSEAVVKDIISPQFTLPTGATATSITLETYRCTGKEGNDYTWSKNADAMGAKATVTGDQVSVTGFNFSENYVGTVTENGNTSYRGNKLVISFKVERKTGFLGGNDVYTNTSAGIYEDKDAENPLLTFDRPTVNVPIPKVTVNAEDKNVYLLGGVTLDQLKTGATVTVGNTVLKLGETNYGLEPWQTEYVGITVEVMDEDGEPITGALTNLIEDKTYTIQVTVSPKYEGKETSDGTKAEMKIGEDEGNINVYKPEVTFKDSEIDLGDKADYANNRVDSVVWKHGNTTSTDTGIVMIGEAPKLTYTYDPEAGTFTKDQPVKVTEVKIRDEDVIDHVTFYRDGCTYCEHKNKTQVTTAEDGSRTNFIVHVKSFDLKIVKTGWDDVDENQSFLFTVSDGTNTLDVVVHGDGEVTIKGLSAGKNYTVTENTNWSWRYTPGAENVSQTVDTSKAENGVVTVMFDNNRKETKWLDGNAYCDNNWATGEADPKSN